MFDEKLIPLKSLTKLLPTKPSQATLYRWASVGTDGKKLKTRKVGARLFVTEKDVEDFCGSSR